MATMPFWLTDTPSDNGGAGERLLAYSRGAASATHVTATTASGNNIQETLTSGGTACSYLSPPLAAGQAITNPITANIRGRESVTTANAGIALVWDIVDGTNSSVLATLKTQVPLPAAGATEFSTSDAAKALASQALTNTYTTVGGERLRLRLFIVAVGTMAVGTVTTSVGGPTSGAAGDSSVTSGDTLLPLYPQPGTPGTWASLSIGGGTNTMLVPVPPNVITGCLVEVRIHGYWAQNATAPTSASITPPAGHVLATGSFVAVKDSTNAGYMCVATYYHYATGTESGTYSYTMAAVGGSNAGGQAVARQIVSTLTSGTPYVDSFHTATTGGTSSASSVTISTFTPAADHSLLTISMQSSVGAGTNVPTGFVQGAVPDASDNYDSAVQGTAAATGSLTYNFSPNADAAVVVGTIRVPPAITPISLTDSGTGTDALTVAAVVPQTDSGAGVDTIAVQATIPQTDSGTGVDSITISAVVPVTDTGTLVDALTTAITSLLVEAGSGVDSLTVSAVIPLTDPATGVDALTVSAMIFLVDAGTGVDALVVQVLVALADTGTFVDNLTVSAVIPLVDAGTLDDVLIVLRSFSFTDQGSFVDQLSVAAVVPLDDTGSFTDDLTVLRTISLVDSGSATDNLVVAANISLPDSGTSTDDLSVSAVIPLNETGHGNETFSNGGATLIGLDDQGSFTEDLSEQVVVPLSDTLNALDTINVAASVPLSDAGSSSDTLLPSVTVPLTDVGTLVDALNVIVTVVLLDSGTADDQLTVATTIPLSDVGTFVDNLGVSALVVLADTGSFIDVLAAVQQVLLSDQGTFTESISVVIVSVDLRNISLYGKIELNRFTGIIEPDRFTGTIDLEMYGRIEDV